MSELGVFKDVFTQAHSPFFHCAATLGANIEQAWKNTAGICAAFVLDVYSGSDGLFVRKLTIKPL